MLSSILNHEVTCGLVVAGPILHVKHLNPNKTNSMTIHYRKTQVNEIQITASYLARTTQIK